MNRTDEVRKVSPAIAVSGLTLFGYPLPDVIQLVTLI
jgi:hypothetical protein